VDAGGSVGWGGTGGGSFDSAGFEYEPAGGLLLSGLSEEAVSVLADSAGGLLWAGEGEPIISIAFDTDGQFQVSGVADRTVGFSVVESFTWRIRQTVSVTKEFTWSTGNRDFTWYQVTGKCKPAACPPVDFGDYACRVTFTVNILARNVSEVCRKLKEREFRFPIASIKQFSVPAFTDDFTSATDPNCNALTDVTPSFNLTECVDLLLDGSFVAGLAADMRVYQARAYTMTGGFGASGVGVGTTEFHEVVEPHGAFSIRGGYAGGVTARSYMAYGLLRPGGAATATPGQYLYAGGGRIGVVGIAPYVSSAYTVEPVGTLLLSGNRYHVAEGVMSLSGAAVVAVAAASQPDLGGAVALGGTATVAVTVAEGTGPLGFGGSAIIGSSHLGVVTFGPLGADARVDAQSVVFGYEAAPPAVRPTRRIVSPCCQSTLPLVIALDHPVASTNYFSHFLSRNHLVLPSSLNLTYDADDRVWVRSLRYEGYSPYVPSREEWHLVFTWNCLSDSLGLGQWRLSFQALLIPESGRRLQTRLVVQFDMSTVCRTNRPVNFPFLINTATGVASPAASQAVVLVDNLGLFNTVRYSKNPLIRFKVSEASADGNQETIDITTSLVAAAQQGRPQLV
jgi:hypothetical protein